MQHISMTRDFAHQWHTLMTHINDTYQWHMIWHINHMCVIDTCGTYSYVTCHIRIRHVTYQWIVSHMNTSCHIWMRHVTHECDMSHMNASCDIRMSHVAHTNESCMDSPRGILLPDLTRVTHMNKRVMSHIWMSHVTHMNASCHTYEWLVSHTWMSHVTHMNEPCHIWMRRVLYEWVMSHRWMSHVTHK